jgi:hypothetical protein
MRNRYNISLVQIEAGPDAYRHRAYLRQRACLTMRTILVLAYIVLALIAVVFLLTLRNVFYLAPALLAIVCTHIIFAAVGAFKFSSVAMRLLLLRPFDSKSAVTLNAIARNSICDKGHVFTLSDQSFRPWLLQRALSYAGQIDNLNMSLDPVGTLLFAFLAKLVSFVLCPLGVIRPYSPRIEYMTPRKMDDFFIKTLRRRSWLSYMSCLYFCQPFNVLCLNESWQQCVVGLMDACDIIILDLTNPGSGLAWELSITRKTVYGERCVLIAHEKSLKIDELPNSVYFYDDQGRFLSQDFETELWARAFQFRG